MTISKIWAHAWIDYLFFDTDLYYTFIKNKNYELPDPPIDYDFKSSKSDPVLPVNFHHAFIIRAFHTAHEVNNGRGLLKDRDWRLLQKTIKNDIDPIVLQLLERQTRKMIFKIIKEPSHWKAWLQLFDDENIYEETIGSEDRRESNLPTPVLTLDNDIKAPGEIPGTPVKDFYTIEETAREQMTESPRIGEESLIKKQEFVLDASPSEQFELDSIARTKRQKKLSQIPTLRIDESLITDQDSQMFSPRVPASLLGDMLSPSGFLHKKSLSDADQSNNS